MLIKFQIASAEEHKLLNVSLNVSVDQWGITQEVTNGKIHSLHWSALDGREYFAYISRTSFIVSFI